MTREVSDLTAERVAANVAAVRAEIATACERSGRPVDDVALLAAVKYVPVDAIAVLADAGLTLVGENRAQELERKVAAPGGDRLTWHFIGHLQSRKVKTVLPLARMIHSVSSDSVIRELGRHAPDQGRPVRVLVEVNIAGEEGKSGVAPDALDAVLERCAAVENLEVAGLMTMPPLASDPEANRRWFAALAQLAAARGLPELSMGTTQDFTVAVEEGATIVRVGTRLYQ